MRRVRGSFCLLFVHIPRAKDLDFDFPAQLMLDAGLGQLLLENDLARAKPEATKGKEEIR